MATLARRTLGAALAALLLAAALIAADAPPAGAERSKLAPSAWAWHTGTHVTPEFLTDQINRYNLRIIDIEVRSANPLTFAPVLIQNTGVHAKTWWWYYGVSAKFIKDAMKRHGARILDLENYKVGGQQRYAVVLIKRQGDDSKATPWWLNQSKAGIKKKIEKQKLRIIDIDRKPSGRYDVVFIKNTGKDKTAWWYWYGGTPSFINKMLKDNKARLYDIEKNGNGRFTVVMVKRAKNMHWWWTWNKNPTQIGNIVAQLGVRMIDFERYTHNGNVRYAAVMLNNLNKLSTKLRTIMRPSSHTIAHGFYLKRVQGPVLAALQEKKVFEPASMLKALHHLTALQAVQNDDAETDEDITWYKHPDAPNNGGVCPYQDDGTKITSQPEVDDLSVVLSGMMMNSDNRMTDAIWDRFTKSAINNTADAVVMTQTELNHRIGCTLNAPGVTPVANELTLHNAGLLYEGVATETLLDATHRALFYQYMGSNLNRFRTVAQEEGEKLGLTQSKINGFKNAMRGAYKPGGYTNGAVDCNSNGCTHLLVRSTGGGWLEIPFKSNGSPAPRDFVYGTFVDGNLKCPSRHSESNPSCDPLIADIGTARGKVMNEMFRGQIKAALKTW